MLVERPRALFLRAAAAVLSALILAFAVLTYAGYNGWFLRTDEVTVTAQRAGLVMDRDAKVKYLGVRIGSVRSITYSGDRAHLDLAIDRKQLRRIPANVDVRIASTTIFGAKSVEFLVPSRPSAVPLHAGAQLQSSSEQLEVNTLFQTLVDVLHKVDPAKLNSALTAISQGLRGNGEKLGEFLTGGNDLAAQVNSKMDTLVGDLAQAVTATGFYADAAPDLGTTIDNASPLARTVVEEQSNLDQTLLAGAGLANSGADTLEPGADDYIAAVQRNRALLKVLADYSPQFGCTIQTLPEALGKFGPVLGGSKPGLFASASFLLGVPQYTYPESLPIVNASGGPNCRGLPDMPSKQFGGSWYHAPFLVTDNAYIPYEPFTELQVDAPSTLQFLFNGAFAERDDH